MVTIIITIHNYLQEWWKSSTIETNSEILRISPHLIQNKLVIFRDGVLYRNNINTQLTCASIEVDGKTFVLIT